MELSEIQTEIERRAARIGAAKSALPAYGRSQDFGRPHIEVDSRGLHYVVVERGQELERLTTQSLDELLYRVFEAVTFSLAMEYETSNRNARQDCRRLIFRRQRELLALLDPQWAARCARSQEEILRENPFRDPGFWRGHLSG